MVLTGRLRALSWCVEVRSWMGLVGMPVDCYVGMMMTRVARHGRAAVLQVPGMGQLQVELEQYNHHDIMA
jgi:hypothetical protein